MCLWIFAILLSRSVFCLFTETDTQVLSGLVDYFEPPFLYIVEEEPSVLIAINETFPARNFVLTTVVTVKQVLEQLRHRGNVRHGGMPLVALDGESSAWQHLLQEVDSRSLQTAKWVVFSKKPFSVSSFQSLYIPFDCEFISVNQPKQLPLLTEVYNILKGGATETVHFGWYSEESGLDISKLNFYGRRPNFKNNVFDAVIENKPPYTYVMTETLGKPEFDGYFYQVWKELEFRLKFRTKFHVISRIGESSEDYLISGTHQFLVAPVPQEPKTAQRIALSEPIFVARVHLFGGRPGSELEWNSYLKPFSQETWLITLVWMVGSSIALTILYRLAYMYRASEHEAEYFVFTFPVSFSTVFRALCSQGSDVTPRSNACRLLFLSVYTTALVLTSAFSAALFSLLTIPMSKAPFNSFSDVLNNRAYKIGIIPDSPVLHGFKDLAERFPNTDLSQLSTMIEPNKDLPVGIMEALERVCMWRNYIFMWDLPNVLEGMQRLNRTCQEKVMPGGPALFNEIVGFGMIKGSPYKELIDQHLVRLKNEGILRRLFLNTWPPRIPKVPNSWMKVTLADISPIMYMFVIGVVAGIIILFIEKFRWYMANKSKAAVSPSMFMRNVHFASEVTPVSPTTPYHNSDWEKRYTDWDGRNNLHRRQKEKLRAF